MSNKEIIEKDKKEVLKINNHTADKSQIGKYGDGETSSEEQISPVGSSNSKGKLKKVVTIFFILLMIVAGLIISDLGVKSKLRQCENIVPTEVGYYSGQCAQIKNDSFGSFISFFLLSELIIGILGWIILISVSESIKSIKNKHQRFEHKNTDYWC